jgi:hypothetical protein
MALPAAAPAEAEGVAAWVAPSAFPAAATADAEEVAAWVARGALAGCDMHDPWRKRVGKRLRWAGSSRWNFQA